MTAVDDVRFAFRTLRRWPTGVTAITLTLALSIGVATAIFSVINAVFLHPLAVADPDRLVMISTPPFRGSSLETFRRVVSGNRTLTGAGASFQTTLPTQAGDGTQDVAIAFVTEGYFTTLGVRAASGRTMLPGDPAAPGSNPVVVLSAPLRRVLFGADRAVVGKQVVIRGQSLTVIGVTPDRFRGTSLSAAPDAWVPVSMIPTFQIPLLSREGGIHLGIPLFTVVARLAPGVTLPRARGDIARVLVQDAGLPVTSPAISPVSIIPLAQGTTSAEDRETLLRFIALLVGVVVLTSVLAVMNIGNLLVVRGEQRAAELGIRAALGAGTGRLAQQLFIESCLLALAGGVAGLGVAAGMLRAVSSFALPGRIALDRIDLGLHPAVLGFTGLISLLTAIGFGIAPAFRAGRMGVVDSIRHRANPQRKSMGREALLAFQVSIALVLTVGAGLLVRSIRLGLDTDIGFDPRPLAAVSVFPDQAGTSKEELERYSMILAALRHTPGVIGAAASTHVPLAGAGETPFGPGPAGDTTSTVMIGVAHITDGYFRVLGVPVTEGRTFTSADGPTEPRAIILNQAAVHALWPGEPPLGKLLHGRWYTLWQTYVVVGVVRDTKYRDLRDENTPFAYVSMSQEQFSDHSVSFLVRHNDAAAGLAILKRTLRTVAPQLTGPGRPQLRPRLVSEQIDMVLAPQRFGATLLSGFGVLALVVSAVGIYGTVAYVVSRRTTEIGIRMALGAQTGDVLGVVLRETGRAIGVGVGAGLVGALFLAKLLSHYLYKVSPFDPVSFVVAALVVAVMAMVASFVPSRRAVQIDPVNAIRSNTA